MKVGNRTYFLKTNLMKTAIANKIITQKPKKISEKMSKKNPPKKAPNKPTFPSPVSKRLITITKTKTKFNKWPIGK